MLESIVATILARYLGDYLEGLERENLRIGIMGGNVQLNNLRLKKEALADLKLPIAVKEGFVGSFHLEVPWRSLGSAPAIARVDRVFLIAGPTQPSDYDPEIVKRKEIETKKRRLQVAALMGDGASSEEEGNKKESENDSFTSRLIETIVDNFQLYVDNVHIRYEDNISNPSEPFVLGVTMEHLHAHSTDDSWDETFIKGPHQFVHKLVTLKNVAVYWNPRGDFLDYTSLSEMGEAMKKLIWVDNQDMPPELNYILKPLTGTMKAILNKAKEIDMKIPKVVIDVLFNQARAVLGEYQYRDLMHLSNYFAYYVRGLKYHKFRADPSIRPSEDAKPWWRFALRAVLNDVREKRKKWTWDYLRNRRLDREAYIELYKKQLKLGAKGMTDEEQTHLQSYEDILEFDDIISYRQLARAAFKRDQEAAAAKKKKQEEENKKKGWLGWGASLVFGGAQEEEGEVVLTREEQIQAMKDLYNAIGYDEDEEQKKQKKIASVPPEYVKAKLNFSLGQASFTLRSSRPEDHKAPDVLVAQMSSFSVGIQQRESWISMAGSLKSVAVTEFETLRALEKEVRMVSISERAVATDFFSFGFDLSPLDKGADVRVVLSGLQPMNLTFGPVIIERVAKFFSHGADMSQLKLAANNSWDTLKEQAEMQVKYALDSRKSIDVRMDFLAPNVLIPQNFEDDECPALLLSLGKFSLRTDLENRKRAVTETESGFKVGEDFYYDKFILRLTSINAILSSKALRESNKEVSSSQQLIRDFDVNVNAMVCNVPSDELARIKVSGNLPSFGLNVSPDKVGKLFAVAMAFAKMGEKNQDQLKSYEEEAEEMMARIREEMTRRQEYKLQKKATESNQVQAQFSIDAISVVVSTSEQRKSVELVEVGLQNLGAHFRKTNHVMEAGVGLGRLDVRDLVQPWGEEYAYLVTSSSSKETSDNAKLIDIIYQGIPLPSPKFDGIQHDVKVNFNTLQVVVNRGTLLAVAEFASNTLKAMEPYKDSADNKQLESSSKEEVSSHEDYAAKRTSSKDVALNRSSSTTLAKPDEDEGSETFVLAQAAITMNSVSVLLQRAGRTLLQASLDKTSFHAVVQSDSEIEVEGSFGSVTLVNRTPDSQKWNRIIEIHGDQMVEFKALMLNPDDEHQNRRLIVSTHVGQVRVVFTYSFIRAIMQYLDEIMQLQRVLISENVTAMVADNAADQAKLIQERAQAPADEKSILIYLSVDVDSPQVVIPRNSYSDDFIEANLGNIKINNRIGPLESALVDTITVEIEALNLAAVTQEEGMEAPVHFSIIKPTDMTLTLQRPLNQPTRVVPDIELSSTMSHISLNVSQSSLGLVYGVMAGNMAEVPKNAQDKTLLQQIKKRQISRDDKADSKKPVLDALKEVVDEARSERELKTRQDDEAEKREKEADSKVPRLKAKLNLEKISLSLSSGCGTYESQSTELVEFALAGMSTEFSMYVNGAMGANLGMTRIDLRDTRIHSKNVFKAILGPKDDSLELLYISFDRNQTGDMDATVIVNAPRVMVIPELLWRIKEYVLPQITASLDALNAMQIGMATSLDPEEPGKSAEELQTDGKTLTTNSTSSTSSLDDPSSSASSTEAADAAANNTITAKVKVLNPTLVLIEKPDVVGSRGIIMKTSVDIGFSMSEEIGQRATMNITGVEVYKCRLKSEEATLVSLLSPLDMELSFEMKANEKLCVSLDMGKPLLFFSYQDFKLLMSVKDDMLAAIQSDDGDMDVRQRLQKEREELAKLTAPADGQPSESSSSSQIDEEKDKRKEQEEKSIAMVEKVSFTMPGANLLLLNDFFEDGVNVPVLRSSIGELSATISNWSSSLAGDFDIGTMKVGYFNTNLNSGEPLIEPWTFQAKLSSDEEGSPIFRISSVEPLYMNISGHFISTMLTLLQSWSQDLYDGATQERDLRKHPFYVQNNSGFPLEFWITGSKHRVTLQPGDKEPLELLEAESERRKKLRIQADQIDQTLSAEVKNERFRPVYNLPFTRACNFVFEVSKDEQDESRLLYTVQDFAGSRVLVFGSDMVVRNDTNAAVEVLVVVGNHKVALPSLPPHESRFLPLQVAWKGALRFRPHGKKLLWSSQKLPCGDLSPTNKPRFLSCITEEQYAQKEESEDKSETKKEEGSSPSSPAAPLRPAWVYGFDITGRRAKESGSYEQAQSLNLVLSPPLVIENCLGCTLKYRVIDSERQKVICEGQVGPGVEEEIYNVVPVVAPVISLTMQGFDWSKPAQLSEKKKALNFSILSLSSGSTFALSSETTIPKHHSFRLSVFAKYWLINRSNYDLQYKEDPSQTRVACMQTVEPPTQAEDEQGTKKKDAKSDSSEVGLLPMMFSSDCLCFQTEGSKWSNAIPFQTTNGVIDMPAEKGESVFQMGMTSEIAPGKYWRTSIVTLSPRYVFVNRAGMDLSLRQKKKKGEQNRILLKDGEQKNFDWPSVSREKLLQVRPQEQAESWRWSPSMSLEVVGSNQIKIRGKAGKNGEKKRLRVRVDNIGATTIVFFLELQKEIVDYRVVNNTEFALSVGQVGVNDRDTVKAGASVDFSWDDILQQTKKVSVSVLPTGVDQIFTVDKLQVCDSITFKDGDGAHELLVEVKADGPTKILQFVTAGQEMKHDNVETEERKVIAELVLALNSVGVSVVDEKPQELIFASMKDIQLHVTLSNMDQSVEVLVGAMQVDNQLFLSPFPVLLAGHSVEGKGFFRLALTRSTKYESLLCIPYFAVQMQEADVKVDEQCLLRLLRLLDGILQVQQKMRDDKLETELLSQRQRFTVDEEAIRLASSTNMVYFQLLHINPIRINLTFLTLGVSEEMDYEPGALEKILRAGGFLANIDGAPLRLNGLILEHPFCTQEELVSRIVKHYTFQGMQELYKILGSADFLGSPVSLVSNLGTGVYDFFHEPAEGIVASPQDFAKGLAKGTTSLVKNTVYGVFNSASKITGTISKAATTVSMDSEWQAERARRARNRPTQAVDGVAMGVKDLGMGVFKGVTGLVYDPFKGAKEAGASGFVKGIGKGVTGLVLKPVVGVVDLVTDTAEGIKNTATYFDAKAGRVRYPRFIPERKLLLPYNQGKSEGQLVLRELDKGEYMRDFYKYHQKIADDRFVLISDKRVLYLKGTKVDELLTKWHAVLDDVQYVEAAAQGVIIDMLGRTKLIPGREREEKRMLIPIPDTKARDEVLRIFSKQLENKKTAVKQFRRRHFHEDTSMVQRFSGGYARVKDRLVSTLEDVGPHGRRVGEEDLASAGSAAVGEATDLADDKDVARAPRGDEVRQPLLSKEERRGSQKQITTSSTPKDTWRVTESSPLLPPVRSVEDEGCCTCCCIS